jgi:hypothetical protein
LGMRTIAERLRECEASFPKIVLQANDEKFNPPYASGMVSPKNWCFLRKAQTSVGSSRVRESSQSSTMLQTSSTGPSINVFSRAESSG